MKLLACDLGGRVFIGPVGSNKGVPMGMFLEIAQNLADLSSVTTALINLGGPFLPYNPITFHVSNPVIFTNDVDFVASPTVHGEIDIFGRIQVFEPDNVTNVISIDGGNSPGKIGFFTSIPVTQQIGGAATAGVIYTATEQGMLQRAYDALRTYGLLT